MKPVHNQSGKTRPAVSYRGQHGVAMVEFAMMLPLLTVILIGIFDFGLVLREHQILENAAREGAHYSALPANSISAATDPTAKSNAIKQVVVNYLSQEGITVDAG